ncbi:MAG: DUF3078 domain-containing protein [Bacteroidales bacterium]
MKIIHKSVRYVLPLCLSVIFSLSVSHSAASEDNEEVKDSTVLDYWTIGGIGNLNVNQGYLSNWAEGGESSINATWRLDIDAEYKRENAAWESSASWKYGVLQSGERQLRKNEDKFEFTSKFGYNASERWYYSALMNLKSQLFNGYNYPNDSVPVSAFLAPANFVASIGMDYKPNSDFNILLSPLSMKLTVVYDTVNIDQTKYGLDEDQWFKGEIGGYVRARWKTDLHKNISMKNEIELFSSYLNNPENIDVDWQMALVFKATEFITTTISTHLIYDDDIEIPEYEMVDGEVQQVGVTRAIQFKEMLSIGLSYKF